MTKKYKLLQNDTIKLYGTTLYRIQALRDFADVSTGDLGGYIESEENLSHEGGCWVYGGAKVFDNAEVSGNAEIYGNAKVFDNTEIYGNAKVFDNTEIYGNAKVFNNAEIYGNAEVSWNAKISGNAKVSGNASISHNAIIKKTSDYLTISPIGSRNDILTAYKTSDNIYVKVGCFNGSLKAFEKSVEDTHGDSKYGEVYRIASQMIKLQLNN